MDLTSSASISTAEDTAMAAALATAPLVATTRQTERSF
jgi:hypothetical protein